MHRPVDFKTVAILLLLPLAAVSQPSGLVREGDRFARDFHGTAPAGRRLRINAHGPVNVQAGAGNSIAYTVHLSVRARTEAEARNVIERYNVRVTPQGEWVVLTAPGGPVISTVIVKAPRLDHLVVSTSDGAVEASGRRRRCSGGYGGRRVALFQRGGEDTSRHRARIGRPGNGGRRHHGQGRRRHGTRPNRRRRDSHYQSRRRGDGRHRRRPDRGRFRQW